MDTINHKINFHIKVLLSNYNLGAMIEGCPHGKGTKTFSGGDKYNGYFKFGKF